MRLFLATGNSGKRKEFERLLGPPFEIVKVDYPTVVEGNDMETNARMKAVAGFRVAQNLTIGEDSGLFVDALDGAPGVFSARFGGTDQERIERLLGMLSDADNRDAYFRSIIALAINEDLVKIFQGECRGRIAASPVGEYGFGYDPIFIPHGYDQTFGLLGPEVKDRISHRAMAVKNLRDFLQDYRGVAQPG